MAIMIKFRAWDKRSEIYLYNVQDAYDILSGFVKYDNGEDAEYDEDCFGDFLDDKRYDVEQFTGLKDVNGKDIYVGDIVRMQCPGFREYARYEVKYFIQDVCIFQIVKVTDGSTLFESPSNGHDVEIIGNMHANLELLEEHK